MSNNSAFIAQSVKGRRKKNLLVSEQTAVIHAGRCITQHYLHIPADKDSYICSRPDTTWKDSPRQQAADKLVEAREAALTLSDTK